MRSVQCRRLAHRLGGFGARLAGVGGRAGRCSDGARYVVVGEVLPQQQSLLVFLPGQAVAVVVDLKRLAPGNKGVI